MNSRNSPNSHHVDDEFVRRAANLLETLCNLNYLICVEAQNPELVKAYANQAEQCLQKLGLLIRSVQDG